MCWRPFRPGIRHYNSETLHCCFSNQSLHFLGRDHLTAKTYSAIKWSHEHYHNDVNWYLKADDDTYVIVENLKAMLSKYDPRQPYYLGFRAMVNFKFIAGSLESANSSILASCDHFKEVVGKKIRVL